MGMLDEVKSKKKQKAAENWFKMAEGAKTPEKQIEYYTRSLDVNPYNAEAWFRKGRTLEKMGNFEEAKRSFDLAIEVDPDYQGLIGRKQPDMTNVRAPAEPVSESVSEPIARVEETAFIDSSIKSTDNEQVAETADKPNDDVWVTETAQEDRTSFTPPAGDESIFSNLGSDENNEDNEIFSSSPSDIENESISSFGNIEKEAPIQEELVHEEITEEKIVEENPVFSNTFSDANEKADDNTFSADDGNNAVTFSDNEVAKQPEYQDEGPTFAPTPVAEDKSRSAFDDIEAEKLASAASISAAGSMSSASSSAQSTARPDVIASSSAPGLGQCIDVKIPTNEALKFWAIGIVAMVIAFVITDLLVN